MTFSCDNVDLFLPMVTLGMLHLYVFMHTLNSLLHFSWKKYIFFAFPLRILLHHWMLTTIGLMYMAIVWSYVIFWVLGRGYVHLFCTDLFHVIKWLKSQMNMSQKTLKGALQLHLMFFVAIAMSADADSSTSAPPMFKATKAHYQIWFMAWCGWLALKYPELAAQGDFILEWRPE